MADLATRFWSKVQRGPDCWEWRGARSSPLDPQAPHEAPDPSHLFPDDGLIFRDPDAVRDELLEGWARVSRAMSDLITEFAKSIR